MRITKFTAACGLTSAIVFSGQSISAQKRDNARLTLTGCVQAGEAKGSFMLTNVVITGPDVNLAPAGAFYRFNKSEGLQPHVGHRVEVTGTADLDDVDKGTLKVTTKDGKTTASVTERRNVTAKVEGSVKADAETLVWAGSDGSFSRGQMKANVDTYKFEVQGIKMLSAACP